ncbi:hypothetical protein GYH30_010202 [Glycine max]|nr:hypothetical protein GYH30_010202 [Glycine max]
MAEGKIAYLGPQDLTLLSDIVEVERLPCFKRENDEIQHAFYIIRFAVCLQLLSMENRRGLRYECSSNSKIQVCPS